MEKELVHFNPWHSPESGQFISGPGGASSGGSIFQRRKQKKAMEKAKKAEAERLAKMSPSEKAAETRRRKAEHEADKKKAIESGDPRQISKYTSELSNEELKRAKDRISYIKDINKEASDLAIKEANQKWDKLNSMNRNIQTIADTYDKVAMVNNIFSENKLPRVNGQNNKQEKSQIEIETEKLNTINNYKSAIVKGNSLDKQIDKIKSKETEEPKKKEKKK